MNEPIVLGLIQNIAILLAFSMLYDYIWIKYEDKRNIYLKLLIGLVIGIIGLILMLTPWVLAPGLVFDTRSILLSITGLFFGSIPTVVAMVITGFYRIYLGGDGVYMGIAVIITSGVIGIFWARLRPLFNKKNCLIELLLMGFVVHAVMLACTLLLPQEKIWSIIKVIAIPVMLIHPVGTMLLGYLLINRSKNWENKQALIESEERFRNIFVSNHAVMLIVDPENGKILDANPAATEFYGYTHHQFVKDLFISNINTLPKAEINEIMQNAITNKKGRFNVKHKLSDGSIRNVEVDTGSTIINNKPVLFSIVHDITNRVLAEEKSVNLNKIIQQSINEIYIFSADDYKFVEANQEALRNIGYSLDELKQMTPIDIKPLVTETQFYNLIKPLVNSEKSKIYFETVHRRKNGTDYLVEVHLQKDDYGGLPVFVAIIIDVTEKKMIEKSLIESEEKYRIIIENQTDLVVKVDVKGNFLFVSKSYCELFGKTQEELLGKSFMPLIHDEDKVPTAKAMESLYKYPYECTIEQRAMTKDGWQWISWSDKALLNSEGEVIEIIGVGRNIHERKLAEEAILKSEKKYRQLFENLNVGFAYHKMIFDESGQPIDYILLDVNPTFELLTGLKKEKILNKSVLEVLPKTEDSWIKRYGEVVQTGKSIRFESFTREMNKYFDVLAYSPEKDHFATLFYDVTERKLAEEKLKEYQKNLETIVEERTSEINEQALKLKESQNALLFLLEDINESRGELQTVNTKLEEANKELEAFTYTVSHDLKAPLRAIEGFSNFLLEDYGEKLDQEGLRLINVICDNTKKMDRLIVDLLQLSRVTRNEMHLSNIDMKLFVNQIYNEIATPEIVKQFNFKVNNIPPANADQVLLKQVWVNLISNAIKFTSNKKGCSIEIDGKTENEFVIYSIKDNGVGFDSRFESKLFGVFQRLHKAEEFEGTGVGLSIVKRIINRHGGTVWAESELGKGATFYFSLPVREEKL